MSKEKEVKRLKKENQRLKKSILDLSRNHYNRVVELVIEHSDLTKGV